MANGKLPPHIIELDDSVDAHNIRYDAELAALRVAALKAQNAAIQYEVRTTVMQASISASYRETQHQSPPLGAPSPRQHHEQEQERHEERDHGETLNLRTESPELGSLRGHYDFNRVVQTGSKASGDIPPKRTSSSFSSSKSDDDRLPSVHETVPGRPYHMKRAPSEPRHKAILSATSASAQKRRRLWTENISRKKARRMKDVAPATKMARLGRQSLSSHIEKSDVKDEHILFAAVFRAEIHPLIKTACSQNQSIRSQDQAHSVGRAVRSNAVHIAYQSQGLTRVSSSHRSRPRL